MRMMRKQRVWREKLEDDDDDDGMPPGPDKELAKGDPGSQPPKTFPLNPLEYLEGDPLCSSWEKREGEEVRRPDRS